MSSILKNLFILLAIIGTAALGYYLYIQNGSSVLVSTNDEASKNLAIETEEFLRRLNELKAIKLDGSVFADPRFSSLVTVTPVLQAESVGRANPFELN